ncbi:hypothetical protein KY495_15075 [Massilia sp. PAMC28688]|uniref:hypothetical protein n=1 Tax=Massilia sp. PAMC28688 TaxID=2861283 RepID=UPI001C62A8A3|nr:hypothetical protein [Massilia sp. PAMC28688]QYF92090.1 hypothetical protein KY495_15075 [Massilia sp. PAMC28688]
MKRLIVLMCAVLLGGCAMRSGPMPVWDPALKSAMEATQKDGIERVPYRSGVSSVTVERMAAAVGCKGGQGAGLMTKPGPVEIYRMICDNKQVYMARCEFRQCRPMMANSRG